MTSDIQESDLGPTEVQKLDAARTDIQNSSRVAAQKALSFFENIAEGVKAVNDANGAQEEYIRLLTRAAKARGKQYSDIVDLDLANGKIMFKKREVINGGEQEDNEEDPVTGGEESPTDGGGA